MGATDTGSATISTITTTIISSRELRREDCSRTKHDSAFSNWKILIGSSDWEDHALGKEGVERYMVKNLPNCTSCPGVYELGILLSQRRSGRETSKLDPDFIIPVYLGKSDNVRNRLQQYGRDGAHLENGASNGKLNDCKNILAVKGPGSGLFSLVFAKGFSIVYRWAPMTDSREAEKTEAELHTFDYAWNKGSNGPRRQNDILKRIDRSSKNPEFLQKLQLFPQRRKGIKIKTCKLPLLEDTYNLYTDLPNNFLARVLKFGRSQPLLVSWKSGIDCPNICGVALGHGIVCRRPPSEGKKRCAKHKGMKINATTSQLLEDFADITPVCGFILPDGSSCTVVKGNKRCLEHKGRKVHDSSPQSLQVKKEYIFGPILDSNNDQNVLPRKGGKLNASSGEQVALTDGNAICGVDLEDGIFCRRQPPTGRKRCEEHQGIHVKEAGSKSFSEGVPCVFDSSVAKSCSREEKKNDAFLPSVLSGKSSPSCGMTLQNGGCCSRTPVEGNKRFWQHKGMRPEQNHIFPSIMDDKFSPTCGATLNNGSFCTRNPAEGNKRCWQHKGMRMDANSGSSNCYKSEYHTTASGYSSITSVHEDTSQTCGALLHNGSYCRR